MESHIPHWIQRQQVHAVAFQLCPRNQRYLVLANAKCPTLHVVWHQHVHSTCDLSGSVLKGEIGSEKLTLKIHFSYVNATKFIYFILMVGQRVVVVNMSCPNGSLKMVKEFEQISQLQTIDDCDHPGQVVVRLKFHDGRVVNIALADMAAVSSQLLPTVSSSRSPHMGRIYQDIRQHLAKATAELSTLRLRNARTYHELGETAQFGRRAIRGDTIEEKVMVAKYGDIWQRVHNERLVFGVPLFNSTFKRTLQHYHLFAGKTGAILIVYADWLEL